MAERFHWISSPAVVAGISVAGTVAAAVIGQYSFSDKTICGIREPDMRALLSAYNDELRTNFDWVAKFNTETMTSLATISDQLAQQQVANEAQLSELEQRYASGEKLTSRDFVPKAIGGDIPKSQSALPFPNKTEFQRKIGALYAQCLR